MLLLPEVLLLERVAAPTPALAALLGALTADCTIVVGLKLESHEGVRVRATAGCHGARRRLLLHLLRQRESHPLAHFLKLQPRDAGLAGVDGVVAQGPLSSRLRTHS